MGHEGNVFVGCSYLLATGVPVWGKSEALVNLVTRSEW